MSITEKRAEMNKKKAWRVDFLSNVHDSYWLNQLSANLIKQRGTQKQEEQALDDEFTGLFSQKKKKAKKQQQAQA